MMISFKNLFLLILFMQIESIYGQEEREIEVSFLKGKKELKEAKYYLVKGDNAYLLNQTGNKITIPIYGLKENQEVKLLAINKNHEVSFYVRPKEMYYLKVNKLPFNFRYLFKNQYEINEGFDYVKLVRRSKKKYLFKGNASN